MFVLDEPEIGDMDEGVVKRGENPCHSEDELTWVVESGWGRGGGERGC